MDEIYVYNCSKCGALKHNTAKLCDDKTMTPTMMSPKIRIVAPDPNSGRTVHIRDLRKDVATNAGVSPAPNQHLANMLEKLKKERTAVDMVGDGVCRICSSFICERVASASRYAIPCKPLPEDEQVAGRGKFDSGSPHKSKAASTTRAKVNSPSGSASQSTSAAAAASSSPPSSSFTKPVPAASEETAKTELVSVLQHQKFERAEYAMRRVMYKSNSPYSYSVTTNDEYVTTDWTPVKVHTAASPTSPVKNNEETAGTAASCPKVIPHDPICPKKNLRDPRLRPKPQLGVSSLCNRL